MEGRITKQIMDYFGWGDEKREAILNMYLSHAVAGESIDWSALCDDLGVERRGYRQKMRSIFEEEMEKVKK